MKTSVRLPSALLTVCVALPMSGLRAQAPAAAPQSTATPSVSVPAKSAAEAGDNEGRMRARALAILTPEEQGKLRAARQTAKQDPEVKAAEATRTTDKKRYKKAVEAAMIRSDASVGPLLEKLREAKPRKKNL